MRLTRTISVALTVLLASASTCLGQVCIDVPGLNEEARSSPFRGPFTDGSVINFPPLQSPVVSGDEMLALLENAHFTLTGFRYLAQPTAALPQGTGKEQIAKFCGQVLPGESDGTFKVSIPLEAPSGFYEVGLAVGSECPAPDAVVPTCLAAKFMVLPSYMVTKLDKLAIQANAEDDSASPAEMHFQFAGVSGRPSTPGNPNTSSVSVTGSFPGGGTESSYLPNFDNTTANIDLPVFVGRETRMFFGDCAEEAASYPPPADATVLQNCQQARDDDKFSDDFQVAVSGAELDESSGTVIAALAGIGIVGVSCYLNPDGCVSQGNLNLGLGIGNLVQDALAGDDDNLGSVGFGFRVAADGVSWSGVSGDIGIPQQLAGGEKGEIIASLSNELIGGLRILSYRVSVDRIVIEEGYDGITLGCPAPNEVFVNARAFLLSDNATFEPTVRFPPEGTIEVESGDFISFNPPIEIKNNGFENPPESPVMFVEIGVWEDDGGGQPDLIGLYSETINLQDAFARGAEDESGGLPVRTIDIFNRVSAEGFAGSDDDCGLTSFPDPDHRQGRAIISYQLEATWLKQLAQ